MVKHYNSKEYANYTIAILKDFDIKLSKEEKEKIRSFKTAEEVDIFRERKQAERIRKEYELDKAVKEVKKNDGKRTKRNR